MTIVTRGALQRGLILEDADQIRIPRFRLLEAKVDDLIGNARRCLDSAKGAIADAEANLLDALGLRSWSPPEALAYTASLAAVSVAERLDAQYYQPAKLEMVARLGAMPGSQLRTSFDVIRDLVDPGANPTGQCRNYDLTDALQPVLDGSKEPVTFADMESQKVRFRDGDLAVARLRSYLREIAVVRVEDDIPSVGSSEFYVLRRKSGAPELTAEALMIYLRSSPVQTILKWCQDGSQHPRFAERDLMAIPLPDCVAALNEKLTAKVTDALASRAESIRLLAITKRAVEVAIEGGEAAALTYLSE